MICYMFPLKVIRDQGLGFRIFVAAKALNPTRTPAHV